MENCDMLMHLSDDVRKVFEACLPQRDAVKLQELGKLLTRPPLFTTIRINFLKEPKELIKCKLQEAINQQFSAICSEAAPTVIEHNNLEDVLLIPSHGPLSPPRLPVEVVVDSLCGCAVLRGAHVFAQGIIGAPASLQAGDQVSVYADLDARCKKGLLQPYQGRTHFVGNGIAQFSRADLFKSPTPPSGIGVLMNAPHFWSPSLSDLLPDLIYAQNLPSALTSHVLNPLPGQLVIDMCSAPGGKTTHIATLMKNQGRVVALDKSSRIKRVRDTARAWNLNSIETYSYDATKACRDESDVDGEPPYPAGCFDRVLVDAPCSALGQRPCLRRTDDDKQLSSHSKCQRSILQTARLHFI